MLRHNNPTTWFWCYFMLLKHSLCCRVIELILSGPCEAALDAVIGPQSLDDVGQVLWQDALLLCCCWQGKQLAGIILISKDTSTLLDNIVLFTRQSRSCRALFRTLFPNGHYSTCFFQIPSTGNTESSELKQKDWKIYTEQRFTGH